jgi:hypothetical protein
MVNNISFVFYGIQSLIIVFTEVRHWTVSKIRYINTSFFKIRVYFNINQFFHLCLYFPRGRLLRDFPIKFGLIGYFLEEGLSVGFWVHRNFLTRRDVTFCNIDSPGGPYDASERLGDLTRICFSSWWAIWREWTAGWPDENLLFLQEAEHWRISRKFSPFLAGGIMSEHSVATNVFSRLTDLHKNWYEYHATGGQATLIL